MASFSIIFFIFADLGGRGGRLRGYKDVSGEVRGVNGMAELECPKRKDFRDWFIVF